MSELRLYGIPNCDTVKKARTFLEAAGLPHVFQDFKKNPPTIADIQRWEKGFGGWPVNRSGQTYRKFRGEFEALGEDSKASFLCLHSSMLKRPILERDGSVLAFGFDPASYKKLLD